MKFKELLFKYRNYAPIAFYIIGFSLAQPREDLFVFGMILVLVGEILRLWGLSFCHHDSTVWDQAQTTLITGGAYAHIRNPIFTGNMFMAIGMIIAVGGGLPHLLFIGLFFFPIMYQLLASLEEEKLSVQHGETYDAYRMSVPRFYPRISPYPDRSKAKGNLGLAIKNERYMFLAMVIMLVLLAVRWSV